MRFEIGDRVIIRVRADESEEGVPEFYSGAVIPPRHTGYLSDPTNYFVEVYPHNPGETIFYREVTFYDIMPYHNFHLQDLGWESQTAARALRHMKEMWDMWYKANG